MSRRDHVKFPPLGAGTPANRRRQEWLDREHSPLILMVPFGLMLVGMTLVFSVPDTHPYPQGPAVIVQVLGITCVFFGTMAILGMVIGVVFGAIKLRTPTK